MFLDVESSIVYSRTVTWSDVDVRLCCINT